MRSTRKMINLSESVATKAEQLKLSISNQVGKQISWTQLFELLHTNRDQIINQMIGFNKNTVGIKS